jgi:hypothetical protein
MLDVVPSSDGAKTSQLAQALESLCIVEVTSGSAATNYHVAAVIQRFAATITELQGPLSLRLLDESDGSGRLPVLSTCTRLELLTDVSNYKPSVWLGLSQLHTLRGVDLRQVSIAAIAAALPRLHTLAATRNPLRLRLSGRTDDGDPASVASSLTFCHGCGCSTSAELGRRTTPPRRVRLHRRCCRCWTSWCGRILARLRRSAAS